MEQFRADCDIDMCRRVLIDELAPMACSKQFPMPHRTISPATREAGLVQMRMILCTA